MSHPSLARILALSALALAIPGATPALAAHGEVGCADVDVINIRGTAEPSGSSLALDGSLDINNPTGVWSMIRMEMQTPTDGFTPIGQIVRTDLSYPATIPNPLDMSGFYSSVRMGILKTVVYINEQNVRCPEKRFVILGYSQGAIVAANTISAINDRTFYTPGYGGVDYELTEIADAKVVAIGLFADAGLYGSELIPSNIAGKTSPNSTLLNRSLRGSSYLTWPAYLNGTFDDLNRGKNDGTFSVGATGIWPRTPGVLEAKHYGQVRNYCIWHDPICENTSGGFTEHVNYAGDVPAHRNLAIFVIQQLKNRVDKSLPVTCTIPNASNAALIGTNPISGTMRFKAEVKDHINAGGTTTLGGITTSISFTGTSSTTLRNTILGGSPMAYGTLAAQTVSATGATPASKNLTSTGSASSNLATLTAGQPWTAQLPNSGTRSLTFLAGAAGSKIDLSVNTLTVKVTGYGAGDAWAFLSCTANVPQQTAFGRIIVS